MIAPTVKKRLISDALHRALVMAEPERATIAEELFDGIAGFFSRMATSSDYRSHVAACFWGSVMWISATFYVAICLNEWTGGGLAK